MDESKGRLAAMTLSEETQMSVDLKPETTYTVFLLPFAYSPVQRDEKKAGAGGPEWRELAWDPPAPIVITENDLRERILKQKKEELSRILCDKQEAEIALAANTWFNGLEPEERQKLERMEERAVWDEDDEAKLVWRLQYFLPETNMVLFDRAKWFELRSECAEADSQSPVAGIQWPTKLTLNNGIDSIPLKVHWARLALFEWPEGLEKAAVKRRTFARNGILAIKVGFDPESHPSMHHLLALNETFRYYKIPFLRHPDVCFKRHEFLEGLPGPAEDEHLSASYHAMWENLLSLPLRKGEGCFSLFPEKWKVGARQQAMAEAQGQALPTAEKLLASPLVEIPDNDVSKEGEGTWDIYPDNRAFVWTCADIKKRSEDGPWPTFEEEVASSALRESLYTLNWHALLDVDATPSPVDPFRYEWLRDRTYRRWASTGSLYGFNNFSVALMGNLYQPAPAHFERMYLDMGMLLLQVRTSLFRASQKITRDTKDRLANPKKKWQDHFRDFRDSFAAFVNLYQFPLLSTQQQAIEMYVYLRKWMDVDDLFAEVKSEIESTHEMVELQADKQTQRWLNGIAIGGVLFAVAGIIGQILGMTNICSDFGSDMGAFWRQFTWVIAPVAIGLLCWAGWTVISRRR